jgi:hypothetical protein
VTQRNDQVFQLSLTEIAFTIAFLLLLLLGYLVFMGQAARQDAEKKLADAQTAQSATDALNSAKTALATLLQNAGTSNPDEVITKLVAAEELRAERDTLQQRVDDLDARLTALTELQNRVEKAAASQRSAVTQDEVLTALALQDQVREALKKNLEEPAKPPTAQMPVASPAKLPSTPEGNSSTSVSAAKVSGKEALTVVSQALNATRELKRQLKDKLEKELPEGKEEQVIKDVVTAAKGYGDLAKAGQDPQIVQKENSDLRGQIAFLKNRLEARGGRDYPPCWADESGKVEFLFAIEVQPDTVAVSPAWPARREAAARELPDIDAVLAGPHSNQAFVSVIQGIFNWSKAQDPECRHYVQLKSSISDAVQSDRARLMVENFFYKLELRR